jgi:hypothetical protein
MGPTTIAQVPTGRLSLYPLVSPVGAVVAPPALTAVPQAATAAPSAGATDRDCSDFDNQRQGQNYFIDRGGPSQDPDRLNADGDGVACVIYSR